MNDYGDNDDWKPPTEAELKVLEAKQERNNQISRLMGEYMLKGYKMLDSLCEVCGTILLETRENQQYCVACEELHSETSKDDPATSEKAAMATVQEQNNQQDALYNLHADDKNAVMSKFSAPRISNSQDVSQNRNSTISPENQTGKSTLTELKQNPKPFHLNNGSTLNLTSTLKCDEIVILQDTMKTLIKKMEILNAKIRSTESVNDTILLCQAVKGCAEAYLATKQVLS